MCGIVGTFTCRTPPGVDPVVIEHMTAMLRHRGPDESGLYVDDHAGLGQCRLSIIDLSSGTQPLHNEDESLWIVYNGEVYNYRELRRDLIQRGHRFYTATDTEVILHLYEEKGPDCLQDLNGPFAFALWQRNKKELFLARDRLGIRPLHYWTDGDSLVFASEIKALFVHPAIPRQIDPVACDQIFTFWTTLSPRTAFKGIHELPPGHYLKKTPASLTLRPYWEFPLSAPETMSRDCCDTLSRDLFDLLTDAVRIRLRADVPVGCYLSGGLDSSALASLVARYHPEVKTFGIRFDEALYDEGHYQQQMVSYLGCNHSEVMVHNEQIGALWEDVVWHCEKPLLRTSPLPLYLLSRLVRQNGFKVVLTGEGADEIFGGYNIFREHKIRRFCSRNPDSTRRASLFQHLYPYIFNNPRLKKTAPAFFARGLDQIDHPFSSHLLRWENTRRMRTFLSGEIKTAIGSYDSYEALRDTLPPAFHKTDSFSKAQYLEVVIFLSNYLLSSQGDRVAMAHSVETRMPYLDYRIIEFMARVPAPWKILGLREKHLLRRSLKNELPESILNRPKHPYRAPIKQGLLANPLDGPSSTWLSEAALRSSGLFDINKVKRLVQKLTTQDTASEIENMALAGIVSCQIIYKRFIETSMTPVPRLAELSLLIDKRSNPQSAIRTRGVSHRPRQNGSAAVWQGINR